MTFQNLQRGPIFRMIALNFAIGVVIIFALYTLFAITRMWDTVSSINPDMSEQEQKDLIEKEYDDIMEEAQQGSPALQRLGMIQWALIAVVTFGTSWRAGSQHAAQPEQGIGYGVMIGIGTALIFVICACSGALDMIIQMLFLVIISAAGGLGGYFGGQRPRRQQASPAYSAYNPPPGLETPEGFESPARSSRTPAAGPDTYFNMGVQAALGGRREEARQHFTHVLQMQPRSIQAWLQLANLADTPDQAWNYIQQARSINPTDPAVMHAVNLIWPQVAAKAQQNPPPQAQPPYHGGAMDDVEIPRSWLPGTPPDAPSDTPAPGDPDDQPPA